MLGGQQPSRNSRLSEERMSLLSRLAQIEQEEAQDSAARPQPSPHAEAEVKAEADQVAAAMEQELHMPDAHAAAHGDPRAPRPVRLPLPTSSLHAPGQAHVQREMAELREQLRIAAEGLEHQRQIQQLQTLALASVHKSPSDAWKTAKDLGSAELQSLACTFEAHVVADWKTRAKARLNDRCPELAGIWAMPEAAWLLCKDQPKLAGANGWAAGMMAAMVDQSHACGKAMMAEIVRLSPEALACSRAFLRCADAQMLPKAGPSGRKRADDFEKMEHLRAGMSEAETTLALLELQQRWEVLPQANRARDYDLEYRLIEALPQTSTKLKDKREKMVDELDEAVVAKQPPPWTLEQLKARIAVIVAAAPAEKTSFKQEFKPWGGRGRGDGKGAERGRGRGDGRGRGRGGRRLCDNCGSADHEWPDCDKVCPNDFCRAKTCPRVRGPSHECTTKMKIFPDVVNNAHGNPYPPPVIRRLRKLNAKYNKREGNQHEEEDDGEAETEHIEMSDHGYETWVSVRGEPVAALHFEEDPYDLSSDCSDTSMPALIESDGATSSDDVASTSCILSDDVCGRRDASGAEAYVGEASLRFLGAPQSLASEPVVRTLAAELQAEERSVQAWCCSCAADELQSCARRLDEGTRVAALALLKEYFTGKVHDIVLAQLLGGGKGDIHCHAAGVSWSAEALAAETVVLTVGTLTAIEGVLVATFAPVPRTSTSGPRAPSARLATKERRSLNVLYAYVQRNARRMHLGMQLVAGAESVAYDLSASTLVVVATKASEQWWRTKLEFKDVGTFAARGLGALSPWSLASVVLLQRKVFVLEANAGEAHSGGHGASGGAPRKLQLMLDTGSNLHVFASALAAEVGHKHAGRPVEVTGVGALKRVFDQYISFAIRFGDGPAVPAHGPFAASGRRDIASVSKLWDEHQVECLFSPTLQIRRGKTVLTDMYELNGLYFCDVDVGADGEIHLFESAAAESAPAVLVSCTLYKSSLTAQDKGRLLAARLHLTRRTLQAAVKNVKGHGVTAINAATLRSIESDTILRRSRMRRKPVARLTAQPNVKPLPGQSMVMDAHGPSRSASPVCGSKYTLHAICKATKFSHDAKSTRLGEEVWIGFMLKTVAGEKRYGHQVLLITIDATPEISDALLGKLVQTAAAHGVTVQRAPGGHHESCADAEQLNDPATRGSEAMLARARRGRAWYVDARIYFCRNRNLCTSRGESKSRLENHTSKPPDVGRLEPYIWGTTMTYVQEERLRDGKGNLDTRCPHGMLYGISGSSYLIYTDKGTSIKRGADVTAPLDELELLERGMPAALREDDEHPEHVAQQLREDAERRGDVPDGGEVYESGDEQDEVQVMPPLLGVSSSPPPAGPAAPAAKQPGRKDHFPPPTRADKDDPAAAGPPSKRLRSRVAKAINAISVIPVPCEEKVAMISDAIYCLGGDELHSSYEQRVTYAGDFEAYAAQVDAFVGSEVPGGSFEAHITEHDGPECCKAARNFTEVVTDLGRAQLDVPATTQEVRDSPFSEEWGGADQRSVDVVHHAGCPYMALKKAEAQGYIIAPSVVQRKLKIEKATGRLMKNGRRSRTALDGAWLRRFRERKRLEKPMGPRNQHVEVADDTLLKLQIAEAAAEDEDIASADLANAYNLTERQRPPIVMRLPDTVDKYDADGNELGLLLVVPHYGEEESGDDLDKLVKTEFEEAGLSRAEGVPALHTVHVGPEAGAKGGMVKVARVVDDFLITAPRGHPVMQRLEEHLKKAFGEDTKFTREPREFAGYTWTRDRRRRLLSMRMTQHVISAVKRFYPGLMEGQRPSKHEAQGLKMHEVLDGLELPEERGYKLSRQQKLVQEITGALKFPEKVIIALSLPVHRLARVGSCAPPEAYLGALLTLEHAWDHKHDALTFGPGEQRMGLSTRVEINLDEAAPAELQGTADATWGLQKDVFGYIATKHGAAIMHGVKNINVVCESSYASEGVATQFLVQKLEYAQNIEQAFGAKSARPTVVGTDSSSNLAVGNRQGAAATRSKHTLRRWTNALRRMEDKQIYLVKVDTDNMPADFLTKFLGKVKLQKSLTRATNSKFALPPS